MQSFKFHLYNSYILQFFSNKQLKSSILQFFSNNLSSKFQLPSPGAFPILRLLVPPHSESLGAGPPPGASRPRRPGASGWAPAPRRGRRGRAPERAAAPPCRCPYLGKATNGFKVAGNWSHETSSKSGR